MDNKEVNKAYEAYRKKWAECKRALEHYEKLKAAQLKQSLTKSQP